MKHTTLNILLLWLFCLPFSVAQTPADSFYDVGVFNLALVSPDSNYNHHYESPRISGLKNPDLQLEINRFLKSKFFPSRQAIREFKSEFINKYPSVKAAAPHWDYLESSFQINLKTTELLMLERNYIHEYEGMTTALWGAEMYTLNMISGEWIEYLYELFDAKQDKDFNHILRSSNETFSESQIYVDLYQHKDFSIFENKDHELWLVLYIPPYGEYQKIENGELITYSNSNEPMRFEFPLKSFKHLVVKDSVLKKVIHKRAQ